MNREIPGKEEVTPPSPLMECSPEPSEATKDNKKEKMEDNTFSHLPSKSSPCSKCGPIRQLDDYKVEKGEKGSKEMKIVKPLNIHQDRLEFKTYRM